MSNPSNSDTGEFCRPLLAGGAGRAAGDVGHSTSGEIALSASSA